MFAIDVNGREYLVTARHLAEHIVNGKAEVWRNNQWLPYPVTVVGHGNNSVDVSVLALPEPIVQEETRFPLSTGSSGLILGQEVMFLGFPGVYDFSQGSHLHHGFPLPLVKYARLSAFSPQENVPMWFDGHVNRGFSGGPLCFQKPPKGELFIAGVVGSFEPSAEYVVSSDGKVTGAFVFENAGFIHVWDIAKLPGFD